jgi:hypothetical protein
LIPQVSEKQVESCAHTIQRGVRIATTMKYTVPLFHTTWGSIGVGPQNWDNFQCGFGIVLREDSFEGVTWDLWWRPRLKGERRKAERRQTSDRRVEGGQMRLRSCGPQEIFQVLRAEKKRRKQTRRGAQRRQIESDTEIRRLPGLVNRSHKGIPLTNATCALLAEFFGRLCHGEGFEQWKVNISMLDIFEQRGWSESEHREKFRDYAVASCLEQLRRDSLDWRTPNGIHMESISEFAKLFPRAPAGAQRKALRTFVEGLSDLGRAVKILHPKEPRYPLKALFLVWMNRNVQPKPFFEKLSHLLLQHGITLSSKPGSYRKQIGRLKDAAMDYEEHFKTLQA